MKDAISFLRRGKRVDLKPINPTQTRTRLSAA